MEAAVKGKRGRAECLRKGLRSADLLTKNRQIIDGETDPK
jgi:hypothetical protein